MSKKILAVCVGVFISAIARADDWPQFRGPDRTGVSKEKGLLPAWPKEGPKLLWTFKDAGVGFSTVSVAKGVVYTLGTDMKCTEELIIALDEKKGTQRWTAKLGPIFTFKTNIWGDGPRSTPTIDGNLLFALSGTGELVCVDLANQGKDVWRKNLEKDFGGVMMTEWGYSESPLVDGDLLICTPGGPNGTLAALEKKTGKLVWQTKEWTQKAPYSSAVVADIHGVRQYIQTGYTGGPKGGNVSGVDTKGKVLWSKQFFGGDSYNIAPTPIVMGNSVFATAGGGGTGGCQFFDINAQQAAVERFTTLKAKKILKNNHGGVVLIDGHVYGQADPKAWICIDLKTGAEKWRETNKLEFDKSGAVTAADGKLYLYTDEGGVGLVDAKPGDAMDLISEFTIPQKSALRGAGGRKTGAQAQIWAHPVIANGVLYLRDSEFIFAYQISK